MEIDKQKILVVVGAGLVGMMTGLGVAVPDVAGKFSEWLDEPVSTPSSTKHNPYDRPGGLPEQVRQLYLSRIFPDLK